MDGLGNLCSGRNRMNEKNNTPQPGRHPERTDIGHSTNATAVSPSISQARPIRPADSFWKKVWNSLNESIGEIIFGMVDGTVSFLAWCLGWPPARRISMRCCWLGQPAPRQIVLYPIPRNSRASTHADSSKAASVTICAKKLHSPLPKL